MGYDTQDRNGDKGFYRPTSFDFRQSRLFRMGTTWGAASYMQIMASELSDKLLAELLEVDAEMTITMHIQTVDQSVPRWSKATGQHPSGAGLLRFPTKQREAFYQSAKEVYREINYTGT